MSFMEAYLNPDDLFAEESRIDCICSVLASVESWGLDRSLINYTHRCDLLSGIALEHFCSASDSDADNVVGALETLADTVKHWTQKALDRVKALASSTLSKMSELVNTARGLTPLKVADTVVTGIIAQAQSHRILSAMAAALDVIEKIFHFLSTGVKSGLEAVKKFVSGLGPMKSRITFPSKSSVNQHWVSVDTVGHMESAEDPLDDLDLSYLNAEPHQVGWTDSTVEETRDSTVTLMDHLKQILTKATNTRIELFQNDEGERATPMQAIGKMFALAGKLLALSAWLIYRVILGGAKILLRIVRKLNGNKNPVE